MHRQTRAIGQAVLWLAMAGLCSCSSQEPPAATQPATRPAEPAAGPWRALFDGKTLTGWKTPDWGGSGDVTVEWGTVHMEMGVGCTGITYTGEIPRDNYEVELEAMRIDGSDFFCGLTFPVGTDPITLIVGGWGGTTVGLSCLDGNDASENETTQDILFELDQWYHVRARVTGERIEAFLDGNQIINVARKGRKISIRPEVDLSVPLGIAMWQTRGAVRKIRIRELRP